MSVKVIYDILKQGIEKYAERDSISLLNGTPLTFTELKEKVDILAEKLLRFGLKKGDKISILSENSLEWVYAYFAINKVGAITVPLLIDFSKTEIESFIEHSEARMIIVSQKQRKKIEDIKFELYMDIETQEFDNESELKNDYPIVFEETTAGELATIIYTSGTTGASKGVMLSHENLITNVINTCEIQRVTKEDKLFSILPLPHTYELSVGLLILLYSGGSIVYFEGKPVASRLLPALKMVRPTYMLTVPLIMEKIYYSSVKPKFTKSKLMAGVYKIPIFRKLLHKIAGKKLMETFGGRLQFFGVGGAGLDPIVEKFLIEAKFPYAIGYGLTETSPLLTAATPQLVKYRSAGFAIPNVQLKLFNKNLETGVGEIVAKAKSVMMGYYKNEELTKTVFTDDGWFRTGDLGVFDKENRLYIKGRIKNVIIGSTGENIYPEEIENVINNHNFVQESVVLQSQGRLVARVFLDQKKMDEMLAKFKNNSHSLELELGDYMIKLLKEIQHYVNIRVNAYSKVAVVIENTIPFERTATQKIKRYLYKN